MTNLTLVPPATVDLDFEARMSAVWSQAATREADLAVSTARVVRLNGGREYTGPSMTIVQTLKINALCPARRAAVARRMSR